MARIGRIWADGQAVDQSGLTFRLHEGSEEQLPDPLIAAIEGEAPAYRGTAYVVFENLDLTPYGNRIPQFNFEVFRRVAGAARAAAAAGARRARRGAGAGDGRVCAGDRAGALSCGARARARSPTCTTIAACRTSSRRSTRWRRSCRRWSRCRWWRPGSGRPALRPLHAAAGGGAGGRGRRHDALGGVGPQRGAAALVSRVDGRPVFGGTPADATVVQAIRRLRDDGRAVMFYPFILMDIQARERPRPIPGRARRTSRRCRGAGGSRWRRRPGGRGRPTGRRRRRRRWRRSSDAAGAGDFDGVGGDGGLHGPAEWSYRRFVLHYAHLCALAGGRRCLLHRLGAARADPDPRQRGGISGRAGAGGAGRGGAGDPGRARRSAMRRTGRSISGTSRGTGRGTSSFTSIRSGRHAAIDFVGIDNYMPLSDWRDGAGHADAAAGSIYNLDYLRGNVAGGEGYDWYYASAADRRSAGALADHRRRLWRGLGLSLQGPGELVVGGALSTGSAGVKGGAATAWQPRSKPIWFTELGCPAVDKGTNQPNVFHDPKSSESFFPYFSSGARDDLIQYRYLQATFAHWADPANNPALGRLWRAGWSTWRARTSGPGTRGRGRIFPTGTTLVGRRELRARALAERAGDHRRLSRRWWRRSRRGAGSTRSTSAAAARRGDRLPDRGGGERAAEPAAADARLRLRQRGGRRELAFASRGGSVVRPVAREGCVAGGRRAGGVADAAAGGGDGGAGDGRVRPGGCRLRLGAVEAIAPEASEPSTDQMALPLVLSRGRGEGGSPSGR